MRQCRCNVFSSKVNFEKKLKRFFPTEKFPFLVLARNTIMLQRLILHFSFHRPSSVHLREVINNGKFQIFSSQSGGGRLREVVAYKRFQKKGFDSETFGIFQNWSLRRGGRLREVVTTRGSTVFLLYFNFLFPSCLLDMS